MRKLYSEESALSNNEILTLFIVLFLLFSYNEAVTILKR